MSTMVSGGEQGKGSPPNNSLGFPRVYLWPSCTYLYGPILYIFLYHNAYIIQKKTVILVSV